MNQVVAERLAQISDNVAAGYCEDPTVTKDILWLCAHIRQAHDEILRVWRAFGGLARVRDELQGRVEELSTTLTHAVKRAESLEQQLGKGRYCPQCKDWLQGLQGTGTHCGTCMGKIEWRDLSELRSDWGEAVQAILDAASGDCDALDELGQKWSTR